MSIIAFPIRVGAWSQQEQQTLCELRQNFAQLGTYLSLSMGQSVEGEAWALMRNKTGGVVVHIARRSAGVVLVGRDATVRWATTVRELVNAILKSQQGAGQQTWL